MSRTTKLSLFCCVLMLSHLSTDAYGFSRQSGTKRNTKNASQASVAKRHQKDSASVVQNNGITKDTSVKKKETPKMPRSNQEKSLILDFEEVKRLHQQLTKEIIKDPSNKRKLNMSQNIEKQIKTRHLKNQGSNRNTSQYNQQVTSARKVQPLVTPRQSVAATYLNAGQHHSDFQTNSQQHVTQQRMQQNIIPQKHEPQHSKLNSQVQLQTFGNANLQHQSNQQQRNIAPTNTILIPHSARQAVYRQAFIRRQPFTINTRQLNGGVAHQIPSQHILVPVSALSSHHIRNGQGLLQNRRIVLLNPMFGDKTLHVVSNGGKSIVTSKTKLPKSPSTTAKTTPPSTTISMQTPTATGEKETTTASDKEKINQDVLQRRMKKQELEMRKLRRKLGALQREMRNSLLEIENEDGHQ